MKHKFLSITHSNKIFEWEIELKEKPLDYINWLYHDKSEMVELWIDGELVLRNGKFL